MPYMLRQRLEKKSSLTGTPTWRHKLPSVGRYTALELVIDCNRHADRASGTVVYPLETQITKIELLEGGSRALLSLTAAQLDACNYWDFKQPNARRYRQDAATGNILHLFLMGGRHLYDREFGFDFSKLDETYLEYTHTFLTDTAEKFDVSDHEVTVYGWRWMGADAPNFSGYRRIRQLAQWTTTASDAEKVVEVPTGYPVRRIGVQSKTRATTIGGAVKEIELRVNDGEYIPVSIKSPMHWVMQEVSDYGLNPLIGGIDHGVSTDIYDLPYWYSYYQTLNLIPHSATVTVPIITSIVTSPARFNLAAAEEGQVAFSLTGWGFQKCLRIGFDHDYAGFDLLQTAGLGSLDLKCVENAASKDVAVFVEDLLRY